MNEDPDDADDDLGQFTGHAEPTGIERTEEQWEERQIDRAIIQAEDFDDASTTVHGVVVHSYEAPTDRTKALAWRCLKRGTSHDIAEFEPPESMIGSTLLKMRSMFAENKKSRRTGNLRSGRIQSNRLHTVVTGNDKVFARVTQPGKKDYFVCLALDVSGSTSGSTIDDIKRMGMSLGNMLSRAGVRFAIYAHTGMHHTDESGSTNTSRMLDVDVFPIKEEMDPWDVHAKERLANINSSGYNLDGHALEFFRKRCDKSQATDKIILYVTDGAMPETNSTDETVVLVREIKTCREKQYSLIGVGMGTDSPRRHGLDTIRVDDTADLQLLIREMEKRLVVSV